VSEAPLDGNIKTVSLLGEAARRSGRHWGLALIALLCLECLQLLLVFLVEGAFHGDNSWLAFAGLPIVVLAQELLALTQSLVVLLVGIVTFYVFYRGEAWSSRPLATGRFIRFAGRAAIIWFVVIVPQALIEFAFILIGTRWGDTDGDLLLAALVYFSARGIAFLLLCYLHARLVLLLPSTIYSERPESIMACWRATRPVLWALFGAALTVNLVVLCLEYAADALTPRSVFAPLSLWFQDNLGLGMYIQTLFPHAAIHAIGAIVAGLFTAGISVVAYRGLIAIDGLRVEVFD
jgi:hypothetical protein